MPLTLQQLQTYISKDGKHSLQLVNNNDIENLTEASKIGNLIEIVIKNCQNFNSVEGIATFTELQVLYISNVIITNTMFDPFLSVKSFNFRHLTIQHCQLSSLLQIRNLNTLLHLDISNNVITSIVDLKNLRFLTHLNISHNLIENEDECKYFFWFADLQYVNVYNNPFTHTENFIKKFFFAIPETIQVIHISDENLNEYVVQKDTLLRVQEKPSEFQDYNQFCVMATYEDLDLLYDRTDERKQQVQKVITENEKMKQTVDAMVKTNNEMLQLLEQNKEKLDKLKEMKNAIIEAKKIAEQEIKMFTNELLIQTVPQ